MKEIEIYKIENEEYPDSLQQLLFQNIHTQIKDPISQHLFSKKFTYFYYRKIDTNHYTLFSAGFDQIPNTLDDIYPDLSWQELKKFGLVKPQNK